MRKILPEDPPPAPDETPLIPPDGIATTKLARKLGVHPSTVIRWIRVGCKGTAVNGVRPVVRLDATRLGGRVMVSRAAFERFSAILSGHANPTEVAAPGARTSAQRRRDSEAAGKLAERLGA